MSGSFGAISSYKTKRDRRTARDRNKYCLFNSVKNLHFINYPVAQS